ncbi:hypothetical protein [Arthrobacter sp. B1805]|uniref:hypothetical protein n=1 Tax=Arthrobacter sp. B1805 TaxID=2058892 RepID=UPI002157F78C|nr:hypothetical protein [Arthrobacter sp. B1805]
MADGAQNPEPAGAFPPAGLGLFAGPQRAHDAVPVCSRKGCRSDAEWQLMWNNPRIHTPERRKAWASCPDHVEWFEEYLRARGLWKETLPLASDRPMETR